MERVTRRGCRLLLVDARREDEGDRDGDSDNRREAKAMQALAWTSLQGACLFNMSIVGKNESSNAAETTLEGQQRVNDNNVLAQSWESVICYASPGLWSCTRRRIYHVLLTWTIVACCWFMALHPLIWTHTISPGNCFTQVVPNPL